MNIQSNNRNKIDIDFLRPTTKSLYYNNSTDNEASNKPCSENLEINQQSVEQVLENSYYNDDPKLKSGNKLSAFTTCRLRNSSSQSLCSKYLYTEKNIYPVQYEKGVLYKNRPEEDMNIKIYDNVDTKSTFKGTDVENHDKSTYCRPVSHYNQQFIYKTMEKNAKLQWLVKELVIARQQEKVSENWNNYIQQLRIKHSDEKEVIRAASLQYVPEDYGKTEKANDCYNTKFAWTQSNPCQNLLQDIYNVHDISQLCYKYYKPPKRYDRIPKANNSFQTNPICYPTSSQGRFILLERERQKRNDEILPHYKSVSHNKRNFTNLVCCKGKSLKKYQNATNSGTCPSSSVFLNTRSTNTPMETSSTQTEFKIILYPNEGLIREKVNDKKKLVSRKMCTEEQRKIRTIQENTPDSNNITKQTSLACIEEKLDRLIHSINNFIVEIKTQRCKRNMYLDRPTKLRKENVNFTRSDSCGIARKEKIICQLFKNSSRSTRNSSEVNCNKIEHTGSNLNKVNEFLLQNIEINKLKTLKDSFIRETYRPCSVQISVNIPTKEISTEVTRSLVTAQCSTVRSDIKVKETEQCLRDNRITIAVNTDPLSLLALLKVSTEETLRKLLSFIPNIDYYHYLLRLQGPQPRSIESHYVCNICGAVFAKPSQLTDHIQKHELGQTRDCCVCRHVLDIARRRPGLFKCQYCGQRFTRAYCCELHQQSCATRLGISHDVASSLTLLR